MFSIPFRSFISAQLWHKLLHLSDTVLDRYYNDYATQRKVKYFLSRLRLEMCFYSSTHFSFYLPSDRCPPNLFSLLSAEATDLCQVLS